MLEFAATLDPKSHPTKLVRKGVQGGGAGGAGGKKEASWRDLPVEKRIEYALIKVRLLATPAWPAMRAAPPAQGDTDHDYGDWTGTACLAGNCLVGRCTAQPSSTTPTGVPFLSDHDCSPDLRARLRRPARRALTSSPWWTRRRRGRAGGTPSRCR